MAWRAQPRHDTGTLGRCQPSSLLDHLVGASEQRLGNVKTERFGSPEMITSSNLVCCMTGRSTGQVPLRIALFLVTITSPTHSPATRSGTLCPRYLGPRL